jgi:hypothetical protein
MFKKLTKAEAGRLDSVLFNAVKASNEADNVECSRDALDVLLDLRDQQPQADPTTRGFRTRDV